mmetsp:Transcript_65601/g.148029  ORF Transcript_65601/g.148029 Transcript_65601/m.148029 type:complete len:631 (+) Transcript_65601:32-1924(+)
MPVTPRTAAESVKRWDKELVIRDRQIIIVSTQNEQLRSSMGRLEAEMQQIQNVLLGKESALQAKARELIKKDDEIRKLKALEQQDKGKERAIDVAATQNGQLLGLLELHEAKTADVTQERDKLADELADFRGLYERQLKRSAAIEAELRKNLADLDKKYKRLEAKHLDLVASHDGFQELVAKTQRDARAVVRQAEDELETRRDKQYGVMVKVQELEDSLRETSDAHEQSRSHALQLGERSDHLQGRLQDLMALLHAKDSETEALRLAHADEVARLEAQGREKDAHASELSGQMDELGKNLLGVVAKYKDVSSALEAKKKQVVVLREELVDARKAEAESEALAALKDRELERAKADGEAAQVDGARLKRELASSLAELRDIPRPAERQQTEGEQRAARIRSMANQFGVLEAFAREYGAHDSLSLRLDLSGCAVEDSDLGLVVDAAASLAAHLTALDLSSNLLGDSALEQFESILTKSPKLRSLDLRGNMVSIEVCRKLALFLESGHLRDRSIRHVYVHRDGQIEAIGPEATTLLTIDLRSNGAPGPASHLFPTPPAVLEKLVRAEVMNTTGKRARRPAKTTHASSSRKEALVNVYGAPQPPEPRREQGLKNQNTPGKEARQRPKGLPLLCP